MNSLDVPLVPIAQLVRATFEREVCSVKTIEQLAFEVREGLDPYVEPVARKAFEIYEQRRALERSTSHRYYEPRKWEMLTCEHREAWCEVIRTVLAT